MTFNPETLTKILQQLHGADDVATLRVCESFRSYLASNNVHPSQLRFEDPCDDLIPRQMGLINNLQTQLNLIYKEKNDLKAKMSKLEGEVKKLRAEKAKIEASVQEATASPNEDIQKIISTLQDACGDLGLNRELEKKVAALETNEASLKSKAAALSDENATLKKEVVRWARFLEYLERFVTKRIIDICDHQSACHEKVLGEPTWSRR